MNPYVLLVIVLGIILTAIPSLILLTRLFKRLYEKRRVNIISLHDARNSVDIVHSLQKIHDGRVDNYLSRLFHLKLLTPNGLAMYMASSRFGWWWAISQVVFSVAGIVITVTEAAMKSSSSVFLNLEVVISVFFTIDYLVNFYSAEDRLKYFFSWDALIDMFSVVSVFTSIISSSVARDLSVIQMFRILRILRVLRSPERIWATQADIKRQILQLLLGIVTFVLFVACVFQQVESLYLIDSVYFTVVTLATVGYGDISPKTTFGKIWVVLTLFVSIFLTALLTSKLVALVQQTSPYDGSYKRDKKRLHIVVLGQIKYTTLKEFMREFTKHDLYSRSKIVIMSTEKPSTEVKALLKIPYYKRRVTYILGSEMVMSDLERIDMKHASACFVLANRYVKDAQQIDAETIMRCLAVRSCSKQVNIFAQIIKTENKSHATQSGVFRIMSLQELTMGILARNCMAPGFSTLMANLLRTFPSNFEYEGWKEEYYDGCTQLIYAASFPSCLIGRSYFFCVRFLYEKFRALLIGVKVVAQKKVQLTPLDHTIGVNDIAFVIAQSQAEANRITEYVPDDGEQDLPKQDEEMVEKSIPDFENNLPSAFQSYNDLFRPYLDTITGPWRSLYNVHEEPIDLLKVTKKTIKFTGHIVVTGSLIGLADFILPLRSRKIRELIKIVILHPTAPDEETWDNIGVFPEVYFVHGTAPADLRRAGANSADKVVFLCDPRGTSDCDMFRDANNVITARVTEAQNHPYFITTEFAEETSIKFLSIHKGQHEESIDTLSEDIADALSWLTDNEDPNALPEYHFSEYFVSGQVFASSMLDSLLCQYYYNPYLSFIIKAIISGDKPNNKVNTHFYQVAVPEEYADKPYSSLFDYLLQYRIIAIGLYRHPHPQNAPASYVYTNPRPDTIVYAKDKVFVMAAREPVIRGHAFSTVLSTSTPPDLTSPPYNPRETF